MLPCQWLILLSEDKPCSVWSASQLLRPETPIQSLILTTLFLAIAIIQPASGQSVADHPDWPGKGQLFVGTCYQPIDRTPDEIHQDIAIMKKAGFNLVRMGDLSWDSFEPSEGRFEFAWFDKIIDEMQANGIKVILDIPGLPAPIWLHHKYPGVNVVTQNGVILHPAERYMEDISDPDYRRLAPVERYLDLHRFWSDQTIEAVKDLEAVRRRNIPNTPAVSNLWDTAGRKGFDYLSSYKEYVSYGAEGFYPGDAVNTSFGALMTKGDLDAPIWFNEFTAGGGGYYGTRGRSRMWAYIGLINYAQTILAWTFNSHLGGEEQALFGLVDHDGTPSWKVDEFAQIASEFRRLQSLGFPRFRKPEVAIAYSFDSYIASNPPGPSSTVRQYYQIPYQDQVRNAFEPFFTDNIDTAIINIAHDSLDKYKLVVVPGDYIMDEKSAGAIRHYVEAGGTVVMTAYSAKADEHAQWFNTPLPGRLSDVFGLHTNEFYRSNKPLEIIIGGETRKATDSYYEMLELNAAKPYANFLNTPERSTAVAINHYGRANTSAAYESSNDCGAPTVWFITR